MDQFQKYFVWLIPIWMLLVLGIFAIHWRRHTRYGVVFPQVSPDHIRFHETSASGCSHKTTFTRFAGAARCLQVTVTDDEVWVRAGFPFSVLAFQTDLEHRIPRASIVSVQPSDSARSLLLDYRDEKNQAHRLSLMLRRPGDFLGALGMKTQTV
jgi:hypothetical protein